MCSGVKTMSDLTKNAIAAFLLVWVIGLPAMFVMSRFYQEPVTTPTEVRK